MSQLNKTTKHVEVLMASTKPELWEIVINDKIASQAQNQADADYIAFFRVKDKELEESIVTHFAKVKSINSNASITDYLEKYPQVSSPSFTPSLSESTHSGFVSPKYGSKIPSPFLSSEPSFKPSLSVSRSSGSVSVPSS